MTILWTGVKILIFWHIFHCHCMVYTSKINFCIHIKRECVLMHIYRWWCTSTSRAHKLAKTPKGLEDIRQLTPRRLYLFPPQNLHAILPPSKKSWKIAWTIDWQIVSYKVSNCYGLENISPSSKIDRKTKVSFFTTEVCDHTVSWQVLDWSKRLLSSA